MSRKSDLLDSAYQLRTYLEEGDIEQAKIHATDVTIKLENINLEAVD
jgi:hypothetical protein